MYFKQLELNGFKSFAERTVIRLEPGVTAVVGPNGCGKSNILDSLRWALGEQRAKELRGSHMQDVIFNGSEKRHPSGMSEVTITFDNADSKLPVDFAEVAVTRRLYRSGESEYLINKAPCLLRDIQELFMDTGVGTQAYSMVGQGKMDLVLSSKPEDRRFLFEEAAGIIKYKMRKRVAVRRLDSADQNLLRLGDIVAEVQRQMRSLKRQVNAAIRYRELTDQLRGLEIRAAWIQHRRLTEEITELRQRFTTSADRLEGVTAQVSTLEARREELGLTHLELERTLMERREHVHGLESEMEKTERAIALVRQQIDFSKEQGHRADAEREEYLRRAADLEGAVERTRADAEALLAEMEACIQAIGAKQNDHAQAAEHLGQVEAQVEAVRAGAVQKMNERARTVSELETIEQALRGVEQRLQALAERADVLTRRRDELAGLAEVTRARESDLERSLAEIEHQRAEAQKEQAERAQTMRTLNEKWQATREQKSSVEARLKSLRELRDTYEGFAAGVRAVMAAKADASIKLRGIVGPAGDLLSAEKEYERAIEAALGGNINNVVVEDADAAKSAIQFLKDTRAGRVTFLPLDIIRSGKSEDWRALAGRPGIVGPAIDFVRFDARLQTAVEYLLQGTLVVETLDDAIRVAREQRMFPRLVTLDGELVSSAGAVTGGRLRHESRGLLGRSAEIAELEEQVRTITQEVTNMADEGTALAAAIQAATERAKALERQEIDTRKVLQEARVEAARHATELGSTSQTAENTERERADIRAQQERMLADRAAAELKATALEQDVQAFQGELAGGAESTARAREALNACAAELADLRVRQAGVSHRQEELQRDVERQIREREAALREAERRLELAHELENGQGALEERVKEHVEQAKALSDQREEARNGVVEAENQRRALLDETEAIDKTLREHREEARGAQAEVHQLELDLRQREGRLGYFEERILEAYHIALAQLAEEEVGTDEYDEETREQLVNDIRDRLQRMGEVNMMAIEEYEELEKREAFLTSQVGDLTQARNALLDVIARSDKKIKDMFLETFQTVADHFRNFFRRLFNGGQARVYLLDESDPLESGIEIEARPPGKKPQSISLLSGGESAMTAIALLFSIFKAKPSPFCILDEVDAPLDDANIGRFLDMLDEFTNESQFIVITHNKRTMARADALYGITMQERGVSQVVSVKFKEPENAEPAA